MKYLGKYLDAICAVMSGLCLVGLIAMNFADSIGRQIAMPVPGAQEIGSFLLLLFFFSSVPILVRENAHIRVGLLCDLYRGLANRVEHGWTLIYEIVSTLLLVYLVIDFGMRQARIGQLSTHYRIEVAPIIYLAGAFAAVGFVLLIERIVRGRFKSDRVAQAKQDAEAQD